MSYLFKIVIGTKRAPAIRWAQRAFSVICFLAALSLMEGGSAFAGCSASLSSTSLAFPTEPIGNPAPVQTVILSNAGTSALSISSIAITGVSISGIAFTGTNATDFTQATTCGTSLAAGSSCTVAILMTPAAAGAVSGSLTITDNASGSPQSVALSGTGVHNVVVSWTAASGATGYNIYRGTVSGQESGAPLNSSPVSGTVFCDLNVQTGQTYYYAVTSVSGECQSAKSAQASVIVPTS